MEPPVTHDPKVKHVSLTNVSLTCITKPQQMATVTYRGGREQCQQLSPFDLNIFFYFTKIQMKLGTSSIT